MINFTSHLMKIDFLLFKLYYLMQINGEIVGKNNVLKQINR
jgi:hypothetical protein